MIVCIIINFQLTLNSLLVMNFFKKFLSSVHTWKPLWKFPWTNP
jgi:hypothetical protein